MGKQSSFHTMGFSFRFSFFFFLFYLGSIEISATLPPTSGNDKMKAEKKKDTQENKAIILARVSGGVLLERHEGQWL